MIGIENTLNSYSASVVDRLMKAIWAAAMWLLRTAFELMDGIGGFQDGSTLVDGAGRPSPAAPFYALWPTLLWIGGAVAVGLFLWQLTLTMVRGGVGFWRAASGPAAYGVATAMTLGVVAALVGAAEGLTVLILQRGLAAENFRTILDHPSLGFTDSPALDSSIDATARAVLLGMIALFGVLPAAVGFLLEMIFRQAVIVVLVATVPITAAGLLANTTATWFWRSVRWMLAAILMKPALALVLVIGVNMLSGPTGIGGLVGGVGVLLISLCCPLALFRLLAFVERGPQLVRDRAGAGATAGGTPVGTFGDSYSEQMNTARFDAAAHAGPPAGRSHGGRPAGSVGGGADAPAPTRAHLDATLDETGAGHARVAPATAGSAPGAAPVAADVPVAHRPRRPRGGVGRPAVGPGVAAPQPVAAAGTGRSAGSSGFGEPIPLGEGDRTDRAPVPGAPRPPTAGAGRNGRPR